MNPWLDQLSSALLEMYPLPDGVIPAMGPGLPPPRVTVTLEDRADHSIPDPLSLDKQYHQAKIQCNRRITSPDWYQDVRHIELSFDDEIRYDPSPRPNFGKVFSNSASYDPGDVAVVHPEIPSQDVDAFLSTMGWSNIADSLYTINISQRGESRAFRWILHPSTDFQTKHFLITSHLPLH